jgi:hypothetical protein
MAPVYPLHAGQITRLDELGPYLFYYIPFIQALRRHLILRAPSSLVTHPLFLVLFLLRGFVDCGTPLVPGRRQSFISGFATWP